MSLHADLRNLLDEPGRWWWYRTRLEALLAANPEPLSEAGSRVSALEVTPHLTLNMRDVSGVRRTWEISHYMYGTPHSVNCIEVLNCGSWVKVFASTDESKVSDIYYKISTAIKEGVESAGQLD